MMDSDNAGEPSTHKTLREQIRERLPDYVTAEALGKEPSEEYPDVAEYLDAHPSLRDELEELRALILPTYANERKPAPRYPDPDLTFLKTEKGTSNTERLWHWNDRGQLLVQLTESLLDLLRPPTLAGATRGQLLYTYDVTATDDRDVDVRIDVFSEDATEETVLVAVTVDVHDADPLAQAGSRVTLRAGEETWTGETDDAGYVEFKHIPRAVVANLEIEVTPA